MVLQPELEPADANQLAGAGAGPVQLVVHSELREPGLGLSDGAGLGEVDHRNCAQRLVAVDGPGPITFRGDED